MKNIKILAAAVGLMMIAWPKAHGMRGVPPICDVVYVIRGTEPLLQLEHSMWSVWRAGRSDGIVPRFTVVCWDVPEQRIVELNDWCRHLGVEARFQAFDPALAAGFPPDGRNQATVMKAFLHLYVNAQKVIYLDTDTSVCAGGLRELWEFELGDNTYAVTSAPHLSNNRASPWRPTFRIGFEVCPVDEGVLIINLADASKFRDVQDRWKTIRERTRDRIIRKEMLFQVSSGTPLTQINPSEVEQRVNAEMQNMLICFEGVLSEMKKGVVMLPPEANTVINMRLPTGYGNDSTPKTEDFIRSRKKHWFTDYLPKKYSYKDKETYDLCIELCLRGEPVSAEIAKNVYSSYENWRHALFVVQKSLTDANSAAIIKMVTSELPTERIDEFIPAIALILAGDEQWSQIFQTLGGNPPQIMNSIRERYPTVYEIDQILGRKHITINNDPILRQMVLDWPSEEAAIREYYGRKPWCLHDEGAPKLFANNSIFSPQYKHLQSILEIRAMAKRWGEPIDPMTPEEMELNEHKFDVWLLSRGPIAVNPAFLLWFQVIQHQNNLLNHVD
ncbi:MAG: hypothetical protein LBC04_01415 [Holosporaceae bacterium]|jgi:hypothetical protein|nr:hypothetical protein [Holosporaceae bacterium]